MTNTRAAWYAAIAALCCASAAAYAQTGRTIGQVIVSFSSDSAAGQQLARLDLEAIDDPTGDARLLEIAHDLGERFGVPLRLEGLTSGRELLLAIDREAVMATAAERLAKRLGVTGVERLEPTEPGDARLAVAFQPDSEFAAAIATGSRLALGEPSGDGAGGLSVEAAVEDAGSADAILALDLDAIARRLLERLQADPQVRYAQPNLLLRRDGSKDL
jgi:hypothetical protein